MAKWEQTQKQAEAWGYLMDSKTNELLFGGGAGGAKSYLGCGWLITMCGQYQGTRWLLGRSKLKDLKETTLNTFFEVCNHWGIRKDKDYNYNSQSGIIKFKGGSEVLLKDLFSYPSDPNFDSLGSLEISGAFIDEANQVSIKARNIVKSRIRYKLDEYGLIPKILYTCNPAKNWTYKDFYKPDKEGTIQADRKFVQALAKDNPFISKHYIENLKKLDPTSKQRLYFGNWEYDDDPTTMINYNAIMDLFTNTLDSDDTKYLVADIARFGKDKTVITCWKGLEMYRVKVFDVSSVTTSINEIKKILSEEKIPYSHAIIDEDGIGGGVVDGLEGVQGFVANTRPFDDPKTEKPANFQHLKAQCAYELANYINRHKMAVKINSIEIKEQLVEELEQIKTKDADKDGKRKIIGKDEVREIIGRSPDCFVAGTKVLTVRGERNIETLKIGDRVVTPFGFRKITHLVKKKADELYTVNNELCGTGNHKVFVGDSFKRIDTLTFRDYIYSSSIVNLFLWRLRKLLHIKDVSIGFREMVDITTQRHGQKEKELKKPCTGLFGKKRMVKSLVVIVFIMLMEMFIIIVLRICSVWKAVFIKKNTWHKDLKILSLDQVLMKTLSKQEKKPLSGINLKKDGSGTQTWPKKLGRKESLLLLFVSIVAKKVRHFSLIVLNFVQVVVHNAIGIREKLILKKGFVQNVKEVLMSRRVKKQKPVHDLVQLKVCGDVDVYSLTLENDNVYFANGYLVENCSDTMIMRMYFEFESPVESYSAPKRRRKIKPMTKYGI